jgi:predicted anti-sigma-YlaC factor YlaD
MNAQLFWKALVVQLVAVALLAGVLIALPLPEDFFEDAGFAIGPLAWIACSLVTARVLRLPLAFVLFAALAGGVAGALVMLAASHWPGLLAALLVFAASCGSYDASAEQPA